MPENRPQSVVRNEIPGFKDLRAARLSEITEPMMARLELAAEFPDANIEPTGIQELDDVVRFQPGRLCVIGGREGAGKSALALQMARYMSSRGKSVLYLLTEMTIEEVAERIVANTSHIPLWQIQKSPTPEQRAKVRGVLEWFGSNTDLTIVEVQGQPIDKIVHRVQVWASHQSNGVGAVFIDNLWGLTGASRVSGTASEVSLGMGEVTRQVASLSLPKASGGVDCPVFLLHHLNREAANGRTPTTAALGGSDQIGYWASQVILVTEQAALGTTGDVFDKSGTHALHLTKNRGGRAGVTIPLTFVGEQMRFEGVGPAVPFAKPAVANVEAERQYRTRLAELPAI